MLTRKIPPSCVAPAVDPSAARSAPISWNAPPRASAPSYEMKLSAADLSLLAGTPLSAYDVACLTTRRFTSSCASRPVT